MIRIISPVNEDENRAGAVAFTCSRIARSIKEAFSDSLSYAFSSENKAVQLLKSIYLIFKTYIWLLKGDIVAFIYPTIPLYPATSRIKYHISSLFYKIMFKIKKISGGKLVFIIIDLPKEQEESFNTKHIQISYDKFLKFENRIIEEASKIIYYSEGFKKLIEDREINSNAESFVCSVGYAPQGIPKGDGKPTKIFYSGELTRSYEKNKLLEICNCLTENEELIVCGKNGEWLNELKNGRVSYKGYVDSKKHDEIAGQCDFGLIVYPDEGYYRYVTPAKLNVYISLGLPVLAISNLTIKKVFETFKAGESVSEEEFIPTFRKWCDEKLYRDYRKVYNEVDYHALYLDSIRRAFQ